MAINEWWAGDPGQRYWMEITDRSDLGADLFAPIADSAGRPYWGYELITYVQPGDVVFHWHKSLMGEPGVVGWSRATGVYEDTDISWQAHGTAGRASGSLAPRPAWRMPLTDYKPLAPFVPISDVRSQTADLQSILTELEAAYPGLTLYFPFGFSDKRPLRAQQTYFVKMPKEVVDLLGLPTTDPTHAPSKPEAGKAPKAKGSGYLADSAVRSAVEMHAVSLAEAHYEEAGYEVTYTGANKPYDLEVSNATETRRVEVKGSTGAAEAVELTSGEVKNSRAYSPTDLFVVDGIQWERNPDGSISAWDGEIRLWEDWTAHDSNLTVTRYRYRLASGETT